MTGAVQLGSQLSVIIPARDEATHVAFAIHSAKEEPGAEVIVADGASRDETPYVAAHAGACLVTSAPGRAVQMNTAAAKASVGNFSRVAAVRSQAAVTGPP